MSANEPESVSEATSVKSEAPAASPAIWAGPRDVLRKASAASKTLLTIVSVLTLFWAVVLFVVGKNELHLVVWVKNETLLYPTAETGGRTLPLVFGSNAANSVAFLTVEVSNYGTDMIGDQSARWELELEAENAQHVAIVGELTRSPEAIVAQALPSTASNTIRLELGALQHNSRVNLELMAVNMTNDAPVRLVARPSLRGLPHEITDASPSIRVSERLGWPAFVSIAIVFAVVALVDGYKARAELAALGRWKLFGRIVWTSVVILVAALIFAVFVAKGIAKAVLWFT